MNHRTLTSVVGAALLLVGAAGCGQSDHERVSRVAEDYLERIEAGEFASACELVAARYRRQLGGKRGCREFLAGQFGEQGGAAPELELAGVGVRGERANVQVRISRGGAPPSPLTLRLQRHQDDNWRILDQQ